MADPVSRTILLLDIEKYSDRDDIEQAYLRRMLYDITDRVLESGGIDESKRLRADRGDSVMELIDASASVPRLLRALLADVPDLLHTVNRMAARSAQIRLRGVVATGFVAVDEHGGWVGSDLNHACRLLDAELLRAALRKRPDGFALCVSEPVHAGVVRHDHPGVRAEEFHPVTVSSKNGPLRAWLHGPLPDGTEQAGHDDHSETGVGEAPVPGVSGEHPAPGRRPPEPPATTPPTAGVTFNFSSGAPSFGGSLVNGDQHGVSGGQVTGDVHLGGSVGQQGRGVPDTPAPDGRPATRPGGDPA